MSYLNRISESQLSNVRTLIDSFEKWGIHNMFTQAAILAVVSKESNFDYKFEKGYGNTSNERIRKVFGSRVNHLSEGELSLIKKNDVAFFNLVYGNRYGNGSSDGYKYRGGGSNQLTFKDNYKRVGKDIGIDLVNHPEKVNEPQVASDIACSYFVRRFGSFSKAHQRNYSSIDINGFVSFVDAAKAIYHANAGFGKSFNYIDAKMLRGGGKKTMDRTPEFLGLLLRDNPMPFMSEEDGNKFRWWVNDNHPDVAKSIDLDRSGSYNNSYILAAWCAVGLEYDI